MLGIDGGLLALSAFLPLYGPATFVPVVLAMGLLNAVVHNAGGAKMSLTYATGTLVNLGEKLADAFTEPQSRQGRDWFPYLLLWLGRVVGAAAREPGL